MIHGAKDPYLAEDPFCIHTIVDLVQLFYCHLLYELNINNNTIAWLVDCLDHMAVSACPQEFLDIVPVADIELDTADSETHN
jgi:hypothetical protein